MTAIWIQQALELEPVPGESSHHLIDTKIKRADMPNLSQRYVAALAQLSQFQCVVGDKSTLTHGLTGVRVAPETMDEDAQDASLLSLTYATGHTVHVVASLYFELQLAEDAAHKLHAVGEGSGERYASGLPSYGSISLASTIWLFRLRAVMRQRRSRHPQSVRD